MPRSGGRTWWAHFELTRINIEPTILKNKIEEPLVVGAFHVVERHWVPIRTGRHLLTPGEVP
jgi:hypothetical protein